MNKYRERIADKLLKIKLETVGGVIIQGPKWCGKTTTAENQANSILYMADPQNLQLAKISVKSLLEGATPRLIDEWQVAPQLWDAARFEIDHRDEPGQFIFTGSAVPADRSKIIHSGTGRFSWLTMRTMSLFESGESNGAVSLMDLFEGEKEIFAKSDMDIDTLAFLICRGGWPGAIGKREQIALLVASDYLDAVINSDIVRVDGVNRSPSRTLRIMKSLSRHQGAQVSNNAIKDDISGNEGDDISSDTIASYIGALKDIFVEEDAPAWNPNLRSKTAIRSSDTRYFVDPSIAAAALGVGPKDLIADLNTMGLMFETLCIRDLRVYASAHRGELYHYRDKTGLECDAVIHLRNGKYGLIEIKLGGEDLIERGAKTLKTLVSKINTDKMMSPSFMMVVVGVGKYAYRRPDGVYVVPISCLKD